MHLLELKCPNCNSTVKVSDDLKEAVCDSCGTKFLVDDEAEHIVFDNAEKAGYDFEKGRQKAQSEKSQSFFKAYFKRIFDNVKWWELVFWWIVRLMMLVAMFVPSKTSEIEASQNMAQMGANFVAMFLWEIFMLFPEKTFLRQLPASIQNITIPFIWLGAYGGAYLGFYYSIWWWDAALHAFGSLIGVILCYEILTAIQKRDRIKMNVPIMLVASVGLCFIFGVAWELFEFTCDQVLTNSDTQHWDVLRFHAGYRNIFMPTQMTKPDAELMKAIANADFADKVTLTVADLKYYLRMSLMDTMSDTVCNAVGGIVGFIIIKIYPYRHKGKNDVNKLFEECPSDAVENIEKEKVNA